MPFSTLTGNERIKVLLKRAVSEDRIAQSLIFAGSQGVGKRQFALALSEAVNCEQPADGDSCGECISCRRIIAGEHLDLRTYSPEGQFIKIDAMRGLALEAQFRPFIGRRRVFIVDEADRLKVEAANAILKILEEPPPTSLILLISSRPYALLDTIRSRCQMLSFAPLAADALETFLKGRYKRPAEEIRLLARLARGSIGRAIEIDLGQYRSQRAKMVELVEASLVNHDTVRMLQTAEYLGKKLERDDFTAHMDTLLIILSDIFYLKLDEPQDRLTNVDDLGRLGQIADRVTVDQITVLADKIETLLMALPRNVN
ncbi:MAG TPA: DNA polymerase III subunit delta', partial [Blastocatellia bacterium]|nr:DNA polymerase III subunit delta' [Blastocatellia bacterium]